MKKTAKKTTAKKNVNVTPKRAKGMIAVGFARQMDPVKWYDVDANTPLAVFLAKIDQQFGANVRVSGQVQTPEYILKDQDIVNAVEAVAGGRA